MHGGVQTVSSLANRWQLNLYDALATVSVQVGRDPDRSHGYGKNLFRYCAVDWLARSRRRENFHHQVSYEPEIYT